MALVITIYDEIREGEAARVLAQLDSRPNEELEVRLNSPGGLVAEGLAIYNAIKPRNPTIYIDGVVASIASLIAMAGKRIIAAENSLLMVHNPWVTATGDPAGLRRTADVLDKHLDVMVSAYGRSGLAERELRSLMDAETWMTAEDAYDLGFVDEVGEALRYAAHSPASYAGYFNTPELLMTTTAKKRGARAADPAEAPPGPSPEEGGDGANTLEAFKKGLSSDAVTKAAHDAVMEELRKRNESITAFARPYMGDEKVRDYVVKALADPSLKIEDVGRDLLGMIGRDVSPSGATFREAAVARQNAGRDFIQAASDALAICAGVDIAKPHAGARDLIDTGFSGIARICASRSGQSMAWGAPKESIRAALSTSDFPVILENTLNKALRSGYEAEPASFAAWTSKVDVPDFKEQFRAILGSAPDLLPVLEGAEYTWGSLDEDKSIPYKVDKFGRIVGLTWETIVNDDMGAFTRTTQALGLAALRAEADFVYDSFDENSGAGPEMQDGVNLFHATHANLATSASAIDTDSLGSARILLRRQTAVGGGLLNLTPRFLLVAPEHESEAEALLAAAARSMSQGSDNKLVNAWIAKLELIVEARLSGNAFYALASPQVVDTFERAHLQEDGGPVIQEEDGFSNDVKKYKVRHVFGGRWLDWRGAVKVPLSS